MMKVAAAKLVTTAAVAMLMAACAVGCAQSKSQPAQVHAEPSRPSPITSPANATQKPAEWGDFSEEMKCRLSLRPGPDGEDPQLLVDVRYEGQRQFLATFDSQDSFELEVDGRWYRPKSPAGVAHRPFAPGSQYNDITLSLAHGWLTKGPGEPYRLVGSGFHTAEPHRELELAPGPHIIRVACFALPTRANIGGFIKCVSKPITVTLKKPLNLGGNWKGTVMS